MHEPRDGADGTQEAMLDLIFASLRIKNSAWMNAFLEGKRLTGEHSVIPRPAVS